MDKINSELVKYTLLDGSEFGLENIVSSESMFHYFVFKEIGVDSFVHVLI